MDDLGALLRDYLDTGREGAVEDLVARTRPRLLAVARRIGAPQDAEDAVQAAYLALVRRREPIDAPVLPWLLRAVIRIAYRRKAIERRQHAVAARLERPREQASAAAAAVSGEERTKVRAQLDRLPDRYRDIVTLHYLEGLSTPEIAALLDAPEATVRTRLRRGRELLRGPLAPVWKFALLALPWLAADTVAAAAGGLAVKKNALAAALALLLLVAGSVVIAVSVRGTPPIEARTARTEPPPPPAPPSPRPVPKTRPGADDEAPSATGLVLDPRGHPVAGARVFVQAVRVPMPGAAGDVLPPRSLRTLFAEQASGGPGAGTGPDGAFRIELDADAPWHTLVVEAKGYAPAKAEQVRPGAHVVVTLQRAPALCGTVRDLEGRPVPGAVVAWFILIDGLHVVRRGRAGVDGGYRIEDLPSPFAWNVEGITGFVAADAEGFAPVLTAGPPLGASEGDELHQDLWLAKGSVIEGRVVDAESRRPLPGAEVVLSEIAAGPLTLETAVADTDGRFVFRAFPVDGFHWGALSSVGQQRFVGWIRVEHEAYAVSTVSVPAVESGTTVAIEVACWPVAAVRGRAVDASGHALEGVTVSGFRNLSPQPSHLDAGGSHMATTTDGDGRFLLAGIPAPRGAAAKMHLYVHRPGARVLETQVEVRAGETTTVADFVFRDTPWPSVVAEVVNAQGVPVWNASVGLHPSIGTATGRDGRARLYAGDGTREVRIAALSTGSGLCLSEPVVPSVESPPLARVVLDATHAVEGTVVGEDGAPRPAIRVSAWAGKTALGQTRTDAQGRFRLPRLPAGPIDLTAEDGDRSARADAVPVDTASTVLTLPRSQDAPTTVVSGSVRDGVTGRPLLRFTAMLNGKTWIKGARTAPGRFRFDAVPPGRWTLVVFSEGYASFTAPLEIDPDRPPDPLLIDLVAGATVKGTVRGRIGAGRMLAFVDERGVGLAPAHLNRSGRYEVRDVKPGSYWLMVAGDTPAAAVPAELVVPEGSAEVTFDFEIVEACMLIVHHAEVAERLEVRDGTGSRAWLRVGAQGTIRLDLPPGTYTVNGRPVEVSLGDSATLDLTVPEK